MPKRVVNVHTSVYLQRDLYRELRKRLVDEGMSFSAWVEAQAKVYLESI